LNGKDERALEVGLFRYTLIRDVADRSLSKAQRGRLVRELAGREHVGPDGRLIGVGRSTIDDWIRAYLAGGFEALCPRPRQSGPLTAARVLCLAEALKRELPGRTAAQVHEVMLASGEQVPTVRTLQRHFARVGLNVRADGRAPDRVYGRFEASCRNELWTGDGLHGPKVAGRTAILLAFIDDYSRALVGYRWGSAEDVLRLEAALRSGLSARGLPDGILVDRGSAFVSQQLLRACAVLGVRLIHASPRAATTKGKVERFFRTVRSQFLVELARRELAGLSELNRLFAAWVESVYHRRVHSETGQKPIERFMATGAPTLPSPQLLREAFLWDSCSFGGDSGRSWGSGRDLADAGVAPSAREKGQPGGVRRPGSSRADGWAGKRQPPPPIGPRRSIAPDGGAVTERSEGKGACDLDSHAAGATIIRGPGGEGALAARIRLPRRERRP